MSVRNGIPGAGAFVQVYFDFLAAKTIDQIMGPHGNLYGPLGNLDAALATSEWLLGLMGMQQQAGKLIRCASFKDFALISDDIPSITVVFPAGIRMGYSDTECPSGSSTISCLDFYHVRVCLVGQ